MAIQPKAKAKAIQPEKGKQIKNELIEITPYQLDKVKVVPFQTRTIIYVVWIAAGALFVSFLIVCLIKFFV